jgi:hypothetical protein
MDIKWFMQLLLYVLCLVCRPPKQAAVQPQSPANCCCCLPALLRCLPDYVLCSYQAAFRKLPGLSADVMPPAGATAAADDGPLDRLPGALATLAHAVLLLQPVLPDNEVLSTACNAAIAAAWAARATTPWRLPDDAYAELLQNREHAAAPAMQGWLQGRAGWPAGPGGAVAAQLLSKVAATAATRLHNNRQLCDLDSPQSPLVSLAHSSSSGGGRNVSVEEHVACVCCAALRKSMV